MKRIMVGFNGNDESRDALHLGDRLSRLEGARLEVAATGLFEPQMTMDAERKYAASSLRDLFAEVSEELPGRRIEPVILEGLPAAGKLIEHAEAENVDLIVVGSTHRGAIGRVMPGSVGEHLLRGSPCPVAIAPRGFRETRDHIHGVIGVAYDGSPESDLALREAEHLARMLEVALRVITVTPEAEPLEYQERLDRRLASVDGELDHDSILLEGDPGQMLAECCEELDLLVIGSRRRGPLRRTLLGGVSAHVFCNAPCPVIVVPRGSEESIPGGADAAPMSQAEVR